MTGPLTRKVDPLKLPGCIGPRAAGVFNGGAAWISRYGFHTLPNNGAAEDISTPELSPLIAQMSASSMQKGWVTWHPLHQMLIFAVPATGATYANEMYFFDPSRDRADGG